MARGALAPRKPRVAPNRTIVHHQGDCPWSPNGVRPGWPGRLRPPGHLGRHRHRRPEQEEIGRPDGVHPGWPGWPQPPRNPGSHQTTWDGLDAPGFPRVHPELPGRPWPPGDPGLLRADQGERAALSPTAGCTGWPKWVRLTGPRPRPLGKRLSQSDTKPKGSAAHGTGAVKGIQKGSRDGFPPNSGRRFVAGRKVGGGTRRLDATCPWTALWEFSRSPCPCVCAPVMAGPGGLRSECECPPQGSISGSKRIRRPPKRSLSVALYFNGGSVLVRHRWEYVPAPLLIAGSLVPPPVVRSGTVPPTVCRVHRPANRFAAAPRLAHSTTPRSPPVNGNSVAGHGQLAAGGPRGS